MVRRLASALVDQPATTVLTKPDQQTVDLPHVIASTTAAEATVRRPENTSVKTSIRRTSRSLISTQPIVIRPQGPSLERVIGHFYRAKV